MGYDDLRCIFNDGIFGGVRDELGFFGGGLKGDGMGMFDGNGRRWKMAVGR